jgi:hypothetical protein
LRLHGIADLGEDAAECVLFRNGGPQWMPGIDAVDGQCRGLDVGAFEGPHVIAVRFAAAQTPVLAEFDHHRRDL